MKPKIIVQGKGKEAKPYLYAALDIKEELEAEGIEFEEITEKAFDGVSFIVTVSAGVAGYYVQRLIDHIWAKKKETPNDRVPIIIIDQSVNISFHLPDEYEKAASHFKKKKKD